MKARIKLWAHCLSQLIVTLWNGKFPHKHGEVIAVRSHRIQIRGLDVQVGWHYRYLGCVCGKSFHEDPNFREEDPMLAQFVDECKWDMEEKK